MYSTVAFSICLFIVQVLANVHNQPSSIFGHTPPAKDTSERLRHCTQVLNLESTVVSTFFQRTAYDQIDLQLSYKSSTFSENCYGNICISGKHEVASLLLDALSEVFTVFEREIIPAVVKQMENSPFTQVEYRSLLEGYFWYNV